MKAKRIIAIAGVLAMAAAEAVGAWHIVPGSVTVATREVSEQKAEAGVRFEVEEDHHDITPQEVAAEVEWYAPDGSLAARQQQYITLGGERGGRAVALSPLTIDNPLLWDLDTPNVYRVRVWLGDGEKDASETPAGIREAEFSGKFGFQLNGRRVVMRGVRLDRREAAKAARQPDVLARQLRAIGANSLAAPATAQCEVLMDMCDREGLLYVACVADDWTEASKWSRRWQEELAAAVVQARRHPSVVIWDIGTQPAPGEDVAYGDDGLTPCRLMRVLIARYDSGRPVMAEVRGDNRDSAVAWEVDIAAPGDGNLRRWRERHPQIILYRRGAEASRLADGVFDADPTVVGMDVRGLSQLVDASAVPTRQGRLLSRLWR